MKYINIFEVVFWLSAITILYVYVGYPLIMTIAARFLKRKNSYIADEYRPSVTIIIPARNEATIIENKIKNTLNLDYPSDLMEIIIVSDCSEDETDSIVRKYQDAGIKLITLKNRKGKTTAQNIAVDKSSGEIIVFSDANAMYVPEAINQLVKHFKDDKVGCVSGELCYVNPGNAYSGTEENRYWKYEKFIKYQEYKAGVMLGANGSIYAVRKKDFVVLEESDISDFIEPLEIVAKGKKFIFERKAISKELATSTFSSELQRKRRIICRSLRSILNHAHLLNPFRHPLLLFEILSHKLLRWLTPIFMIFLFVANVFLLSENFYKIVFGMQLIFYISAFIGLLLYSRKRTFFIFTVPYYFCILWVSSFIGIVDVMLKRDFTVWEPIRN